MKSKTDIPPDMLTAHLAILARLRAEQARFEVYFRLWRPLKTARVSGGE